MNLLCVDLFQLNTGTWKLDISFNPAWSSMSLFSVNGKIDPPADDRIIASEMLVSSEGGKKALGDELVPAPTV